MTFGAAPYPPPPPATHGPTDNPGRLPTVMQSLGLIAGLVLILAVALAATLGSTVLVIAATAGVSGLLLGAVLFALTRPHQRSSRAFR